VDPRAATLALLGRTLLWLVPCLAIWYLAAGPLAWVPAKIASPLIGSIADVKATAERLRGEGVEVGVVLEIAGQMRLVDVFDPDGNRIQLAQPLDG
jgi:hypothetical protein